MYCGKYNLTRENSQLKLLGKYAIEFNNLFPTQIVTATSTVSLPTSQPVSSHIVDIYGKVYIVTYVTSHIFFAHYTLILPYIFKFIFCKCNKIILNECVDTTYFSIRTLLCCI